MSTRSILSNQTLRGLVAGRQLLARNAFTTSSRTALKESAAGDESTDHEKHKQDSLTKQKEGMGQWKRELATDSEEAIKADRDSQNETPQTMQEKTKNVAEETSKHGTSTTDH